MKRALATLFGLLLLGGGAFWWAPYELNTAYKKFMLGLAARRVSAGPLRAWEADSCEAGKPCRCVALVHGMGDTALTWGKLILGEDGAPRPPAGTRILAVDMPGTEDSPAAADYGVRAQARVLRAALESRCPRWTVAGNSLGGAISGWLAVDWPAGVERLVLVNAAGLSDPSGATLAAATTLADPKRELMEDFSRRAFAKPRPVPDRAWAPALAAMRSRPVAAILKAITPADALDARLKDVAAATVVVWGAGDRVLPAEFAARFGRGIKGARVEMIADCGHLPQQECPAPVSRAVFGTP